NIDHVSLKLIPTGEDRARFDHTVLETVLKDIVKKVLQDDNAPMEDTLDKLARTCPTFVVANKKRNLDGPPTLFRSYQGTNNDAAKCAIWEAARGSTAAPTFFKDMYIGAPAPGARFVDGGLKHNNPVALAINEAKNH